MQLFLGGSSLEKKLAIIEVINICRRNLFSGGKLLNYKFERSTEEISEQVFER